MNIDDREWLESHLKGPILTRLDRLDAQIVDLRERVAKVEVRAEQKAGFVAVIVSLLVAVISQLFGEHR